MQTKKNVRTASEQNRQDLPTVSVRIDRMVDRADSKVRAYASANIGRAFAIHGIRVVDSQKGLFVQMPQRSFQKDGTTKYEDVFHPITAEARTELNSAVLSAYKLEQDKAQDMAEPDEEEAPAFGQSM